jgi:hypothetical protein
MTIQTYSLSHTVSSTGVLTAGSAGEVKRDAVNFVDTTPSPDTAFDGLVIPMIVDSHRQWLTNTQLVVSSVSQAVTSRVSTTHHIDWLVEVTSHGLTRGEVISVYNGTDLLAITNVHSVVDDDFIIVRQSGRIGDISLATDIFTGVTRYSGFVRFASASLNFDTQTPATSEVVRVALIVTLTPDSDESYNERVANKEVLWSRVYPVGTQVGILDWSGLSVSKGYIAPYNDEVTLMLVTYNESGTPVVLNYNYEITVTTDTTIER